MRPRPTVADLRALKGKRQLTMLRYFSLDEAAAAEAAGFEVVSQRRLFRIPAGIMLPSVLTIARRPARLG